MKRQKIWIVAQAAQQPPYNTMLRYHNWGKQLIKRGYDVSIFTVNRVHNTDINVIDKLGSKESICEGIKYFYFDIPRYQGNGLRRVIGWKVFNQRLRKLGELSEKPDVVICGTLRFKTIKKVLRGIPIIVDTVDLWPLSIIAYTKYSEKNPAIQLLYNVEKNAYIHGDALIFSMEGGKQYLQERRYNKRINYSKVFHINMGCDLEEYDRNSKKIPKQNDKSDDQRFVITYSGSMRSANHIIQICQAARILHDKGSNVYIRMFGNGPEEEDAKKYCKENGLNNIVFYGRFEKSMLPEILSDSDANIMTYSQSDVMKYGGSQSKLFDYLASGKPIINCGKWGYNLISRYNCGLVVEEQTPEAIADAMMELSQMPKTEISNMGMMARKVAEMYDQPRLAEKLCEVIDFVLK